MIVEMEAVPPTPEIPIKKKRGRKPKPKPAPEDRFKILYGDFVVDFTK